MTTDTQGAAKPLARAGALAAAGFAIVIIAAALFAEISAQLAPGRPLSAVDAALSAFVTEHIGAGTRQVFAALTHLGDPITLTLLGIVVAWRLWLAAQTMLLLGWGLALSGNALLNPLLKDIFARTRPLLAPEHGIEPGWSFPSGHTSGAIVAYGMLAYVLVRTLPARWHLPAVLGAAATALTVGASRVVLQVHFASDVAAGLASGIAWLTVCIVSVELGRFVQTAPMALHSHKQKSARVLRHPWAFALRVLKAFRANQGLLLAGAVAYYALLSIVPLLILTVIALSHFVDQAELLMTLGRYLEWLVPGQSAAIIAELAHFLLHRDVMGWVLLVSMLFFSSLAFTVLENAMSVVFHHRVAIRRRHFLVSAVIPYAYILCLGAGLLLVTLVAGSLQAMGEHQVTFLWRDWSLTGVSGLLLYLLGFAGEVFVLTSIYLVMPVGRPSLAHALVGALVAALLWELSRRLLVWYFSTLSQIGTVYGSLTTAIAVLLSLELAATLLLLGAQVISEYERLEVGGANKPPQEFSTEPVPGARR
ncbi:YihY family inner membrane protein [Roseateles toxinivorans]|uniref:YihY family inner membrane protein n=2 Tax=Roseateles toxinivorans TaxID=270368 RepID=A0A4R6QM33_9BURK|nr:YihY family inner membrane protein [Roseateles toxinivorans]